jgi:quercetin dioxygenase-like cupin family protein
MKRKWVLVLLVVCGAAAFAGGVLATPQSGVSTKTLANKISFGEIEVNDHTIPASIWQARLKTLGPSDAYVVDNTIAPNGTTGWHTHPGPSLIFVIAGTVTNYTSDDCTGHSYSAGTGFVDPGGGDVHMLKNNGSETAETIAVQIVPKDAPRKIDEPAPDSCSS